jgi:putative DeoR family transcriptional regulator (stage III sporulation protein D)
MHNLHNQTPKRCETLGLYICENKATVRQTAKIFNISKSTVHKDVTSVLFKVNNELYQRVREILKINKSERHIRGGMATKRKYEMMRKNIEDVAELKKPSSQRNVSQQSCDEMSTPSVSNGQIQALHN